MATEFAITFPGPTSLDKEGQFADGVPPASGSPVHNYRKAVQAGLMIAKRFFLM
jgi:hypothetical protein